MAAAMPVESARIRPGQYSRQHSGFSGSSDPQRGKENEPLSPQPHASERGRFSSPTKAQPVNIDPKFRLRGTSPEPSERDSRSRLATSSSPTKKGLRSRSRSRSRLFGKDKTDTLNNQAEAPQPYAATRTPEQIDADFVDLLDELQVQPDLRRKLLALNSTVKASMLQGQATLSLAAFGLGEAAGSTPSSPTKRMPIPDLLKARAGSRPASVHVASPLLGHDAAANYATSAADAAELMAPPNTAQLFGSGPARQVSAGSLDSASSGSAGHTKQPSSTSRSAIRDAFKKSTPNLGQGGSFVSLAGSAAGSTPSTLRPRSMSFGKDVAASFGKETPESFATMLKCTEASRIDVARVKRMRAVLAAESPAWISAFIAPECAGYAAMLTRLDELLAMEWREEQHDDMLLHELLRCFVALSTTEVGREALASRAPRPFRQLVELLFSDKKPGDLATRKLLVELLAILLDLQLPASQAHSHSSLNYLVELLRNPCDPAKEAVVDFIKQTHAPRVFKTYVVEIAGVCRDYFWIFCHSQNLFWRYEELHDRIDSIQGPKVPGGMTGGVEFEAMAYLTAHLRLINALASVLVQVKPHQLPRPEMSAAEFHENLFASGIERVLATLRRASQHYYPTTHLELARYLSLASQAGHAIPYHLKDWIESPKLKTAPLLPPLELPSSQARSVPTAAAQSHAGYGMAGAFIAPSAPVRQSSFQPSVHAQGGGVATVSRSNAMRSASQSPSKRDRALVPTASSPAPADGGWDFETGREVEVVGFDRRMDSQFFVAPPTEAPAPPSPGMPSSSTSKRILGLSEAVAQDLKPPTNPDRPKGSLVTSAVQKWESRSISHQPHPNSAAQRPKPSHLR